MLDEHGDNVQSIVFPIMDRLQSLIEKVHEFFQQRVLTQHMSRLLGLVNVMANV